MEGGRCKMLLWIGCGFREGWRIGVINEINILYLVFVDVFVRVFFIRKICLDLF